MGVRPGQWVCMLSCLSHVQLFATLWTVAHMVLLSMGFPRQACWSGLPCPPLGDLSWDRTCVSYVSCISIRVLYHYSHLGSPEDSKMCPKLRSLTLYLCHLKLAPRPALTPGACQKCCITSPAPDLLGQNLHFNNISR